MIAAAEPSLDFNRDVRPILSENCFYCHGQDPAKREAGLRLDDRRVGGQDGEVGGLADLKAATGVVEMALPGGIDGDRPKRLDRRDALIRIQDSAALVHVAQNGIFDAAQRVNRGHIIVGVQGDSQATGKGGAAGVQPAGPFRPEQAIAEGTTPVVDMADQEGWRDAKRLHPGNLVVVKNAAVFNPVPECVATLSVGAPFIGVEHHINGGIAIGVDTDGPAVIVKRANQGLDLFGRIVERPAVGRVQIGSPLIAGQALVGTVRPGLDPAE
jgi:hypothetical protein